MLHLLFSAKVADEQAEIDRKMTELQGEVSKHDQDIQMLQKHLKEAETLLSTALYQARMKLEQISKAQQHSVNSEDLIRFAHRISSTNAVAAPTTWQPGDQRRPFPTDLEMRMGLLARLNELPMSQVRINSFRGKRSVLRLLI
jgi:mediator of RNA polymerase II transcription subunit 4